MARTERARSGQRALRVGEELRHALSEIFVRKNFSDPELSNSSITVTEVRVSPDLRRAKVYIMVLGEVNSGPILEALIRRSPHLRGQLAQRVKLRFSPELEFLSDESFYHAEKISDLLRRPQVARDLVEVSDINDKKIQDPSGDT